MTTLTLFIHPPLFGILLRRLGNSARKKNGEAKVAEKASPPRRVCQSGRALAAAPAKPPRKGATHVKLMMVKVRAMNTTPMRPPLPSRADVKFARLEGS